MTKSAWDLGLAEPGQTTNVDKTPALQQGRVPGASPVYGACSMPHERRVPSKVRTGARRTAIGLNPAALGGTCAREGSTAPLVRRQRRIHALDAPLV